jgi:hypothetical protein
MSGHLKGFGVQKPVYGINDEKTAKKEQLGKYKKPHSHF